VNGPERTRDLTAIGLLLEPVRRALYDYVIASGREVGRNEAAEAAGVQRNLAAFHLDKLVEAGLLEATFRRLGTRRGPGAGRPAKLYRGVPGEVAVSVPARDYQAVAHLLAEAVDRTGGDLALYEGARRAGEAAGRDAVAATAAAGEDAGPVGVEQVLAARGYAPYRDGDALLLRNCPFGTVMRAYPSLICGMNLALIEGLLGGLGATGEAACLDPAPGRCCVVVTENSKTHQS
jgi:predicted ArsR family transcriptional regulator